MSSLESEDEDKLSTTSMLQEPFLWTKGPEEDALITTPLSTHKRKRSDMSQEDSPQPKTMIESFAMHDDTSLADFRPSYPPWLPRERDSRSLMSSTRPLAIPAESKGKLYFGKGSYFIELAQIVADQLSTRASCGGDLDSKPIRPSLHDELQSMAMTVDPLVDVVPILFHQSVRCDLQTCTSLGEGLRSMTTSRTISRPIQRKQDPLKLQGDAVPLITSHLQIPIPNVRVCRGETVLDISATSLQFWEELGFSPYSGAKNIVAFCIFPHSDMILRGVNSLLDMMKSSFYGLKLGTFTAGYASLDEFSNGLVSYSLQHESWQDIISAIVAVCERLGNGKEDSISTVLPLITG